jgi:hypothetical protein
MTEAQGKDKLLERTKRNRIHFVVISVEIAEIPD